MAEEKDDKIIKFEKKNARSNKYLNCILYDEITYYRLFKDATIDGFMDNNDMELVPHSIINELSKAMEIDFDGIRFVIIDGEYVSWLAANDLDDCDENRTQYASQLSDSEVKRLWIKNQREQCVLVFFFPVLIYKKEGTAGPDVNTSISSECIDILKGALSRTVGMSDKDIFIVDKLYSYESYRNLFDSISEYFVDAAEGIRYPFDEIDISRHDPINDDDVLVKIIPCALRMQSPYYYTKEAAEKKEKCVIRHVDSLSKEDSELVEETLKNEIKNASHIAIYGHLIAADLIDDFYGDFKKFLKLELAKYAELLKGPENE